ncbi:M28 family metallopeptidase [Sphingomonas mesophila]|uniref:M28 family metallopeptidase n=1 Tax=Sphingomonas mesophila TaxID=2303576 RepID=UPI000E58469C|nr:M28 family metallopeptidase [Sphingomonas mesophila]
MRRIHLALPLLLALSPPGIAAAQVTPTAEFSTERLAQHVRTLGSDAFEGRSPATAGETKTVAYLTEQFAKAGLQPGGDLKDGKRQWTQSVPLLRSEFAAAPHIAMTVGGRAVPLTQGNEIAARAPLTGDKALMLNKVPLVFAGYGVKAAERGWDDFKGQDLKGKVLVVLVNDPDFEGGEGQFGGKAMTYYGRWTYKYEEGARQGAAGVLVIHETEPASYGWATVKNSNTNAMFDIVRQNPRGEHPPLEGWIQRDLAAQLFAASRTSFEAMKAAARRKDFKPVSLNATLDLHGNAKTEVITSSNVVGILPGRTRPDETVIYTGHWDHLGIGQPDAKGDRIYNGAIDNGTGIAHMIEQARAFARGPRPERSVVFLAVTAEEKGLLGSEYYASNPLYPLGKTAGVINTDVMGVLGPARDFSVRGNQKFGLLDLLVEEAAKRGRRYTPDPRAGAGSFYRSDHFTLAKVGVPAMSFAPGDDLVNGGTARGLAWRKNYDATMYHQPADEFAPDWDYSGMAQDAELLHAVGLRLANSRDWPNWSSDSEFRAVRDRSAAEREQSAPQAQPLPAAPADKAGERG